MTITKQTAANQFPNRGAWTLEQLKLAFYLYCQTPFGRLHRTNPQVIQLAELINRSSSAVAMKLSNFASLDPAITNSGRKGLSGASQQDQKIWDAFHADWEALALECFALWQQLASANNTNTEGKLTTDADFTGYTRTAVIQQRIKQDFFRQSVLASYHGQCCISAVSHPQLLIASHIVPWHADPANRLNPRNGLCLSAIHDKAFDRHLFTLTDDAHIILSDQLKNSSDQFIKDNFWPLEGKPITLPERFTPDPEFIAWHRKATL